VVTGQNSFSRRARPLEILGRSLNDVLFSREFRKSQKNLYAPLSALPDNSMRFRGGAQRESIHGERWDHLGLLASVINDIGLMKMIAARLGPDAQEEITAGEAVAGMILHGLGFAHRPMSLTPQFFAQTPLDLWVHEGVRAEMCNRFKLGRRRADVHAYGGDRLCSELALAVGVQEGIDVRFNHLDTTRFALTGAYVPEADAHAMTITHGYSKDHRPDLKPAGLELMVSPDGGGPCVRKRWEGNTSDPPIFQARAAALSATFQRSPAPRYLVADAQLSHQDQAAHRSTLGFIPRIPHPLTVVSHVLTQGLQWDMWQWLDETTRDQRLELCHERMAPRWRVVSSPAALARAEAPGKTACQRDAAMSETPRVPLQAQRFETPEAAQAALAARAKPWQ
jgi:hypothetical protein